MSMTIIKALSDYLGSCPLLTGGRFNMEVLPEDVRQAGVEYSIAASPADERITNYRDGAARCRYLFAISSVNDYESETAQNLMNTGLFDQLAEWLRREGRKRHWPELPEGMIPRSVRAVEAVHLKQPDNNSGKYQIQCELEYYRKDID